MSRIRVGVIGVGRMGSFHARTLDRLAGVDVVALHDPDLPALSSLADELAAEAHDDPMAVLDAVDAVVIASPDDTHAELALQAIEHGLPTLCEKPLATSLDDALRVARAEREHGRRLVQMGFMREYDPAHRQLIAQLADLGQVVAVHTTHRNVVSAPRRLDLVVGQSIVHDIHTVRLVTGSEITTVHASGSRPIGDSYRHIVVLCTLASGAHAVIEFDDAGYAYEVGVEVVAEYGDAITGAPSRAIRRRGGSIETVVGPDWFGRFDEAYRAQDAAWIESIRGGEPTGPTVTDGVRAHAVVEAILRSLADGSTASVAASV